MSSMFTRLANLISEVYGLRGIIFRVSKNSNPRTDPSMQAGLGVPSAVEPNASLWVRGDATDPDGVLYVRVSGTWYPFASGASAGTAVSLLDAIEFYAGTNAEAAFAELALAIGGTTSSARAYSSTRYVAANDNLITAIGKVDAGIYSRIRTYVADTTALAAIAAVDRVDGQVVIDNATSNWWKFDSVSSASGSAKVIVPGAGTGRWLAVNSVDGTRAIADLALLVTRAVTIVGGTSSQDSADLGLGNLAGKHIFCSLGQDAADATATQVWGVGQPNGKVTVHCAPQATGPVNVNVFINVR